MNTKTFWESLEAEDIVEKVKQVVHEGNVRRVVVKHDGRIVAEFPLTAGVVGAVLAPILRGHRRARGADEGLLD